MSGIITFLNVSLWKENVKSGGQQFPLSVIQDNMFNSLNNLAIWSLTIYMKT